MMASNTPFPYKKRIALILGGFVLLFSAVAARSFYLQVIQHDQLVKLAEKQHSKTISVVPARGGIFDRTGAPLAVSIDRMR
jgi:cell division protein FtsI (penicillin-binding protein 3)